MEKECDKSPTGKHERREIRYEDSIDKDRSYLLQFESLCKHCSKLIEPIKKKDPPE